MCPLLVPTLAPSVSQRSQTWAAVKTKKFDARLRHRLEELKELQEALQRRSKRQEVRSTISHPTAHATSVPPPRFALTRLGTHVQMLARAKTSSLASTLRQRCFVQTLLLCQHYFYQCRLQGLCIARACGAVLGVVTYLL